MRQSLSQLLAHALDSLVASGTLPAGLAAPPLERTREDAHGDFASNVALVHARAARLAPRALAERIVAALPASTLVQRVDIAGPGFINFHLSPAALCSALLEIHAAGRAYGQSRLGAGQRVLLEFVSANPTGPLHVGHGRGAAYGSALAELLRCAGFTVDCEYYVNDAGRQMDILALSVWLRALGALGEAPAFPGGGYRGDYVHTLGAQLAAQEGAVLRRDPAELARDLPEDGPEAAADAHLDALIARARMLLGPELWARVHRFGTQAILDDIAQDLGQFGVSYQRWSLESALVAQGAVDRALQQLEQAGHLYRKDGATWFRASALGDRQDRVVVRENGERTYFANDIAYHLDKFERGYDTAIDIWGADHHGYVPRVQAALTALGRPAERLRVLLVQFAVLYRGGEKAAMSTRSGEFVTLRALREEVGADAARFFYLLRKSDQHLDFDLDLARSRSNDNPVYYVQYAHARICSVFAGLGPRGWRYELPQASALAALDAAPERALLRTLTRYPDLLEAAALACEPHQIAYYLRELAQQFHGYYNAFPFLVDDTTLRNARLTLIGAARQVLANGLGLLGVSAPESM